MAPQFVKPYVKSNKSDRNDAAAICEAMSRPSMRFVALKTTEQQDIQAVHRVRSQVVKQRTAKANQIRGLVGEYGLAEDLRYLDARVEDYNDEMAVMAKELPTSKGLMTRQGVGPVIATALIAALGAGDGFNRGRDFAVTLGLTPKHHGTGGRGRILGISKRGDAYLRTMLIHSARSAVYAAYSDTTDTNEGLAYRPDDAVDIEPTNDTDGLYNVGWTASREWLEYAFTVPLNNHYALSARVMEKRSAQMKKATPANAVRPLHKTGIKLARYNVSRQLPMRV